MSRKFYRSGPFTLTLEQIKWLKNKQNASQVIRWLLELAMQSENFEEYYDWLVVAEENVKRLERTGDKYQLEEWKERRKNILAKLI